MARPRRDDKRERILDAAVIEIAGQGYQHTTVAMIAGRAGVADGTIYLYFSSKEEILVGLFDRAMAQFIAEGRQLPAAGDAAQRLRELITLHLNLLGRDRDLAIVFQVELRHSLHFLDLFSRSRLREYFEAIADIVAQGQREGTFRADLDPLFTAKAIFGILDEMATDWVLARRNTRLAARTDEIGDLVLRGLGAG
ncbi:MAG: TetR/AcrR family transcriptional regulator [Candidatus Krumholzibacteriia bacterium]